MSLTKESRTLQVPFRVERPDRIPVERYYSEEFYALECELLWSRVWQNACRLAEIPEPGDYVEYEILDKSILVVRVDANTIRAYHNACRHRGVQLAKGRGNLRNGFICPFHGWCYGLDGQNTFLYQADLFKQSNREPEDLKLKQCRVDTWGGCAWINLDDRAPGLRESIEPFASVFDAWKAESLWPNWYYSWRVPANWKLVNEAFMEGYHVMQTHPQLYPPGRSREIFRDVSQIQTGVAAMAKRRAPESNTEVDSDYFIESQIRGLQLIHEGMDYPPYRDIVIAEGLRGMELPSDFAQAAATWSRALNTAVMNWNVNNGIDGLDINSCVEQGFDPFVYFCFPNYFYQTQLSGGVAYRIRPLGPEECYFEYWSLTRYPPGKEPPAMGPIELTDPDDPRFPRIPVQDYGNHVKQQQGLRQSGFEYMRLSDKVEGMISNYQRLIDGYLSGLDRDLLVEGAQRTSGRIDAEVADIGF